MKKNDFPKNFLFGTATASYQIEGGIEDRSLSIWDDFSHTPGKVKNGDNGDVACDHYHKYEEDIRIMKDLGINAYRFSISWPRAMHDGIKPNEKGIDFYQRVVDKLLENNITPFITLYHWDLPLYLYKEKNGWLNPDIANYFQDYASLMFEKLGDRVKYWITLNEPWCSSFLGYFTGEHAPGHRSFQESFYVAHNLLRAHGKAVIAFRDIIKDGKIGITNVVQKIEPLSNDKKNVQAANLVAQYINGWYHDPIIFGKYPEEALMSLKNMGLIIPENDFDIISQKIDFFGVNYYTRQLIVYDENHPLKFKHIVGNLPKTEMGWEIYPKGLYDMLIEFNDKYKIPLYITENGMAGPDKLETGHIHDNYRINYLNDHFEYALKAIKDGVNLRGYFVWSLMDNFEWAYGYSKRFGLVYVDYVNQKRYLKDSAKWYRKFLKK
ncbi:MAG: beta-glucosidase [Marinitoga sp. 4572_148]|nr:MAG: beta-glucosidase [Marinitoga sp. 4572_148]